MNEQLYWKLYNATLSWLKRKFPELNEIDLEGMAADAVIDKLDESLPRWSLHSNCLSRAKTLALNWKAKRDNQCIGLVEAPYECDPTDKLAAEMEADKLDPQTRAAVLLESHNMTRREIADDLGIDPQTVTRRLSNLKQVDDYGGMGLYFDAWYVWFKDSRRTKTSPDNLSTPMPAETFDRELSATIAKANIVSAAIYEVSSRYKVPLTEIEDIIVHRYNTGTFRPFCRLNNRKVEPCKRYWQEYIHAKVVKCILDMPRKKDAE